MFESVIRVRQRFSKVFKGEKIRIMGKEIKYLLEEIKDNNQQKEFMKYLINEKNNLRVISLSWLQILSLLLIKLVIELLLIIICYIF